MDIGKRQETMRFFWGGGRIITRDVLIKINRRFSLFTTNLSQPRTVPVKSYNARKNG